MSLLTQSDIDLIFVLFTELKELAFLKFIYIQFFGRVAPQPVSRRSLTVVVLVQVPGQSVWDLWWTPDQTLLLTTSVFLCRSAVFPQIRLTTIRVTRLSFF